MKLNLRVVPKFEVGDTIQSDFSRTIYCIVKVGRVYYKVKVPLKKDPMHLKIELVDYFCRRIRKRKKKR